MLYVEENENNFNLPSWMLRCSCSRALSRRVVISVDKLFNCHFPSRLNSVASSSSAVLFGVRRNVVVLLCKEQLKVARMI